MKLFTIIYFFVIVFTYNPNSIPNWDWNALIYYVAFVIKTTIIMWAILSGMLLGINIKK